LQSGRQSQAALSGQRNGFELRARLVADTGKSDADLVAAEHGIFALRRRVLLIEDLAFPAAIGRAVRTEVEEERVAAEDAAVHQQHDAGQAGLDTVERAKVNGIETVDDAGLPDRTNRGSASSSSRVRLAQNKAPGRGAALPSKRILLPSRLPRTLIAATSVSISGL